MYAEGTTCVHAHEELDVCKNGNSVCHPGAHAQSIHTSGNCHEPSPHHRHHHHIYCQLQNKKKNSAWLVGNPTQSSYTACISSLSGASVNRAIVWSALPKGFTPISPQWFAARRMSPSLSFLSLSLSLPLFLPPVAVRRITASRPRGVWKKHAFRVEVGVWERCRRVRKVCVCVSVGGVVGVAVVCYYCRYRCKMINCLKLKLIMWSKK